MHYKTVLIWLIRILLWALAVLLLTLFTQVGGLILLLCIPLFRIIHRKLRKRWQRRLAKPLAFFTVYMLFSLFLLPPIARTGGKVPLPVFGSPHLKPLNYWTCFLNRHYVDPELRETLLEVSGQMAEAYPGTVVAYMDAQFPLFDHSLPPHITHDDGRKIDIALFWKDAETGEALNRSAPTWIGYGGIEAPLPGEPDRIATCKKRGYWMYDFMSRKLPQPYRESYVFDAERTRAMARMFIRHPKATRVLLEPHLVKRLRLGAKKTAPGSCRSVRHDDHLHLQVN